MHSAYKAWDVNNGSTPFLTPLEKNYTPAIEKNQLTIVSLKCYDLANVVDNENDYKRGKEVKAMMEEGIKKDVKNYKVAQSKTI